MNLLDEDSEIEKSDSRELARLTEVVALRWLITGQNAQKLENLYQEAANVLLDRVLPVHERVAKAKQVLIKNLPSDKSVSASFSEEIDNAALVRTVLHRINDLIYSGGGIISANPNVLNVEHVAPQAGDDHWHGVLVPNIPRDQKAAIYSAFVEQWGNKTLLESPINKLLRQEPWENKRNGFENSKGEFVKGFVSSAVAITSSLAERPVWDEKLISKRNAWISETFCKIWSVAGHANLQTFDEWESENPNAGRDFEMSVE